MQSILVYQGRKIINISQTNQYPTSHIISTVRTYTTLLRSIQKLLFKMSLHSIVVVFGLVALGAEGLAENLTTESLVRKHGYPFEEHTVETEDGYLLGLHRIPYSPGQESSNQQKRPIAFLNHGLLGSSSDWVLLGPGKALAYLLSDAGYDVWMGNVRGNTYSRKNVKYNPNTLIGKFWDYTFHEIGTMDLPAMIDHIRHQTGQDEMYYFGHSLGTTSFFVMSSLNETYQKYIKSAHLMTPLVYLENLSKIFLEVSSKVVSLINPLATIAGSSEFRPNGTITQIAGAALCDDKPRVLCSDILFIVDGFDEITVEPSIISDVLATTPAGISTKCFLHYFQLHDSNKFQQYDYGSIGNLEKYKSSEPPLYPLEKVNVPVFLYYGAKDRLVHKQDIARIIAGISNHKGVYEVKVATHQYLVYGQGVKQQLYDFLLADVESIE